MRNSAETRERDFLNSLLPGYEAEGFTVFAHPPANILPSFMEDYRPDAIAIKEEKKIAIEIKGRTSQTEAAIQRLRENFAQHPEWELRVYYIPGSPLEKTIEVPALPVIDRSIQEVSELRRAGHLTAALMMGWATLEAIGRALLPDQLARPQPAGRLIETLASEGVLTPAEADQLRRSIELRNAAAHGHLDLPVTAQQIDELISGIRLLADGLRKTPSQE